MKKNMFALSGIEKTADEVASQFCVEPSRNSTRNIESMILQKPTVQFVLYFAIS